MNQKKLNKQINLGKRLVRRSEVVSVCLLILVACGIYLNSLNNLFTNWDDSMIYGNPQVRSLRLDNIKDIFTYHQGSTYQPVRVLSYAVDYYFWKLNPTGYHLTNLLFYILTCVMLFLIIQRLSVSLREKASPSSHLRVAIFGSLLFAAHPVHVEAVSWLAARKEVLQGFFFFLAFYLYLKGREKTANRKIICNGFVLITFLLAVLSKPSAIVFPAVILVYEIAQRRNKWTDFIKTHWRFILLSIFISIIFGSVLLKVMLDSGGVKPLRGGSFFSNILISFYAFLYNIKLLIFTSGYSAAYTLPIPNPLLGLRTFMFIFVTFLFFGVAFWSLKYFKAIFFSFLFFFITIAPYLNIVPISTILADRYVFIASFPYCFLLGILYERVYAYTHERVSKGLFKLLTVIVFLFVLMSYSFQTICQNNIWENSYTLWKNAVEKYPNSNTANALMGVVFMDMNMDEKAVTYLEKAVEILPYDYQSRNNLGIVYGRLQLPDKALKEFMTAIWLKPEDDIIKLNLSNLYQKRKEYQKTEEILKHLLSKDPSNPKLHFRIGMLYKEAGQENAAIAELLESMRLSPHIINPYLELGNIYASMRKDIEKAIYYYSLGIEAVPNAKTRVEDLRWMIQDMETAR